MTWINSSIDNQPDDGVVTVAAPLARKEDAIGCLLAHVFDGADDLPPEWARVLQALDRTA